MGKYVNLNLKIDVLTDPGLLKHLDHLLLTFGELSRVAELLAEVLRRG